MEVKWIVTGVIVSMVLIEVVIELKVDVFLVYYGYFWKNEFEVIWGMKGCWICMFI